MNRISALRRPIAALAFFAALASALAAAFAATPAYADPAGRIGRIAVLTGEAQYTAASGEASAAAINQPLTSGDVLATNPGARAEVEIGSTTLRLDAASRVKFDRIDDEGVAIFVDAGRAIVKVGASDAPGEVAVETRDGRFSPRREGVFRFDTDKQSTVAAVYAGALHFAARDSALDLEAGQAAQFWFDGRERSRPLQIAGDEFSAWSRARDERYERQASPAYASYVSPEMTGAADLDAYGNWSETSEYGAVWYPRGVAADWAPYRYGHWVWIAPWGWTWVAHEPWGFAPFHYGRWVQHHGRWAWVPGVRVARPVYAPALVSWIGDPGAGVSASVSVGWFPLAPREVYVPSYRVSETYIRRVNVAHVAHIDNATLIVSDPQAYVRHANYANRESPRAVTVVPAEVLRSRREVAPALLATSGSALRGQPVQAAAPIAAPAPAPARSEARPREFDRRDDRERRGPSQVQGQPAPAATPPLSPAARQPASPTPAISPANSQPVSPGVIQPAAQSASQSIPRPVSQSISQPVAIQPAKPAAELHPAAPTAAPAPQRFEREWAARREERERHPPQAVQAPAQPVARAEAQSAPAVARPAPQAAAQMPHDSGRGDERRRDEHRRPEDKGPRGEGEKR